MPEPGEGTEMITGRIRSASMTRNRLHPRKSSGSSRSFVDNSNSGTAFKSVRRDKSAVTSWEMRSPRRQPEIPDRWNVKPDKKDPDQNSQKILKEDGRRFSEAVQDAGESGSEI